VSPLPTKGETKEETHLPKGIAIGVLHCLAGLLSDDVFGFGRFGFGGLRLFELRRSDVLAAALLGLSLGHLSNPIFSRDVVELTVTEGEREHRRALWWW